MAVSHALKTMSNHVRADGSTYHVVDYNPTTGVVKSKRSAQGYATELTWRRGQAWAIYGFTMAYRETGDARFLRHRAQDGRILHRSSAERQRALLGLRATEPERPAARQLSCCNRRLGSARAEPA